MTITAGTTYVASCFAPSGHYSVTSGGFSSAVDNAPLHAIADSTSANGLYAYTSASAFPSSSSAPATTAWTCSSSPPGRPARSPA